MVVPILTVIYGGELKLKLKAKMHLYDKGVKVPLYVYASFSAPQCLLLPALYFQTIFCIFTDILCTFSIFLYNLSLFLHGLLHICNEIA